MLKRTRLSIFILVLLVILLPLAYAAAQGLTRPLYFAADTELRLLRRGDAFVRIRFSPLDKMNQVYIPAGEFTMGTDTGAVKIGAVLHKVCLHAYWIDQF